MKDFTATCTNPERAADWQKIYGSDTVCIQSPIPTRANLPGHPDALIYMLDLNEMTADQTERLVAHIAQRFNIPPLEVARDLQQHGVPILADDVIIAVKNPQRWLA